MLPDSVATRAAPAGIGQRAERTSVAITMDGPPPDETGTRLTVDLDALVANWRTLAARAPGAETAGVLKANAYGTGLAQAAAALAGAGCRSFFVAHLAEARALRAVVPQATIHVLNGLLPQAMPIYAADDIRPVIGTREELEAWSAFCRAAGRPLPAALHVDTGMNRMGFTAGDVAALPAEAIEAAGIALVMSHLVSAEVPGDPLNARQIADFAAVRARFPAIPASLANSSGIFLGPAAHHELTRPGFALYGGNPTPGQPNPMRPVVTLEARVLRLADVPAGEGVGYNATWRVDRPSRIATLSIGYADGLLRGASRLPGGTGGEIAVNGVVCPLAGRVSMDLIGVDVTAVPRAAIRAGDLVEVIGPTLGIDRVGASWGTSGYEVLTALGRRHHRIYRGG